MMEKGLTITDIKQMDKLMNKCTNIQLALYAEHFNRELCKRLLKPKLSIIPKDGN